MTRILSLTLFALLLAPMAEAKKPDSNSRPALLARIEAACQERISEEYPKYKKICSCVSRNLDAKLGAEDLELITRSHEEDPEAETEMQNEKHNDLILFDYDVTEGCLTNPNWKP